MTSDLTHMGFELDELPAHEHARIENYLCPKCAVGQWQDTHSCPYLANTCQDNRKFCMCCEFCVADCARGI